MTTKTLDLAKVKEEVIRLANENPTYVYPTSSTDPYERGASGCSYVADSIGAETGKGCLIGQGLQAVGVPRELLALVEEFGPIGVIDLVLWLRNERGYMIENREALDYLERVQSRQDAQAPWGEAVEVE